MISSNKYRYMYVDVHTHFHEYSREIINKICQFKIVLFAVSDDITSSKKTITLSKQYPFLIPCVGVHPWSFEKLSGSIDVIISDIVFFG